MKKKLTRRELRRVFKYDPKTGIFTRKVIKKKGHKGQGGRTRVMVATENGFEEQIRYATYCVNGKQYTGQRLAFLYMEGYLPENDVDHINGIKDDNRWCNLREVSRGCNLRNSISRKPGRTGVVGVAWAEKAQRFVASLASKHIGSFKTLPEAAKARWEAEVEAGWPGCQTTSPAKKYLDSLL